MADETPSRKLGDLTVAELLSSSLDELKGLDTHLEKGDRSDRMFNTITGAYIGSVMARIANAQMKLGTS